MTKVSLVLIFIYSHFFIRRLLTILREAAYLSIQLASLCHQRFEEFVIYSNGRFRCRINNGNSGASRTIAGLPSLCVLHRSSIHPHALTQKSTVLTRAVFKALRFPQINNIDANVYKFSNYVQMEHEKRQARIESRTKKLASKHLSRQNSH